MSLEADDDFLFTLSDVEKEEEHVEKEEERVTSKHNTKKRPRARHPKWREKGRDKEGEGDRRESEEGEG